MSVVTHGEHTVAATAARLATSNNVQTILVQPLSANTDAATHFGGSGVTTATGFPVAKGAVLSFEGSDTSDLFVVGTTAGDKVRWLAIGRD